MAEVMTGVEIKAWRKSVGLEQKTVAIQMGVSPATLCRIEQEDRAVTGEQLDRLYSLYANLRPDSPVVQSATRVPEIEIEKSKLKKAFPVQDLTILGTTYPYQDYKVVPSHYYAMWSGQEPKHVNQAIDRLAERGRLEIGEDFFKLNHAETKDFILVTKCDLDPQEVKKGLTLITRKTVNRLTHYFDDPNSLAKSDHIDSQYTTIEEVAASDLSGRAKLIYMTELCNNWLAMDEKRSKMGAKIAAVSKNLSITDAKLDATKAALEAHKQSSRLTSDQIEELENIIRLKIKEYGHGCVKGLVLRYLKQVFLGDRASGNTYKDIACRHYEEALVRVRNWIPTPLDRESIQKHRVKDGLEPTPPAQRSLFPNE